MKVAGLFAGIGGFELGMGEAGHEAVLLVENFEPAAHVLRARFPEAKLETDVRDLTELPDDTDLVVAGFPCQDLSSVGQKNGIAGTRSKLVGEVFRLLERQPVPWVVLENVPFLLHLDRGHAMTLITSALEELGYSWAYRVVDTQAFGLPQRRRRIFIVATLVGDPRGVLLAGDQLKPDDPHHREVACGFYWTEGKRALGWAVDAVPPIKGGSTVGVPSPPAILLPDGIAGKPHLEDAERLQGFSPGWTRPAEDVARVGFRWQLVGNAVSVPVAAWLGHQLKNPGGYDGQADRRLPEGSKWPRSAWRLRGGEVWKSEVGPYPMWAERPHLEAFLERPLTPLSPKALSGFLSRTRQGSLRFPDGFIEGLMEQLKSSDPEVTARSRGLEEGQEDRDPAQSSLF